MSSLVLEHLNAADLPRQWAERLKANPDATLSVRIEAEETAKTANSAFGRWKDRADIGVVDDYLRRLRESRR